MKNILILGIVLIFSQLQAQVPTWQWARSSTFPDSNGIGEGTDIATDLWGNAFVTGYFVDSSITFGQHTLYSSVFQNSDPTIFVAKYDALGNVKWARNAGGVVTAYVNDIKTDIYGNIYLTGNFAGSYLTFGTDTLWGSSMGMHAFIVKYDSSGSVLWTRCPLGTNVYGSGITCDFSGNAYVTGYFFGGNPVTFGSYVLTSAGGSDVFIVKYDPSGNVVWAKSEGDTETEYVNSIAFNNSNNTFAITGSFRSAQIIFGTDTLPNANSSTYDLFVAKYDALGNNIWAKRAGGTSEEDGRSIIFQDTDNIYVFGMFHSAQIWFDSYNFNLFAGVDNAFIVKYDPVGDVVWATQISGGNPFNIDSDNNYGIYINGQMHSSMTIDSVSLPYPLGFIEPMFIAKYDSSGHALFAMDLSSGGDDWSGLATGPNGSVYIGGDLLVDPFIVGNDTIQKTGVEDVFVAKLGFNTGVGLSEYTRNDNLNVFPNPSSGSVTIQLNGDYQYVSIVNLNGQTVFEEPVKQLQQLQVHINHPGMYLIKAISESGVQHKTIAVTE